MSIQSVLAKCNDSWHIAQWTVNALCAHRPSPKELSVAGTRQPMLAAARELDSGRGVVMQDFVAAM